MSTAGKQTLNTIQGSLEMTLLPNLSKGVSLAKSCAFNIKLSHCSKIFQYLNLTLSAIRTSSTLFPFNITVYVVTREDIRKGTIRKR